MLVELARALLAGALGLGLLACNAPGDDGGGPPPVLLYLVDTLRADHLEIDGYERQTAPHLAALAADGVVFEHAYATSSWTKPSTASILTGLYPSSHQVRHRSQILGPELTLLAESLRDVGYETAGFTTNPWIVEHWGFDQGFETFESLLDTPRAQLVVDRVLEHLTRVGDSAWFTYVHALDPHGPYAAPPGFQRWPRTRVAPVDPANLKAGDPPEALENAISAYDAEIAYGDHHFGRLLARLVEDGSYERSLIIFTSDHGEELLDHGQSGHGRSLHQEVVRVPLVIKFPGNRSAGTRIAQPVSLLDIAPTILGAVDAPVGEAEGIDLAALLSGDAGPGREIFFDLDLVHAPGRRNRARGVVTGASKLIHTELPEPGTLLFDLADDPTEQHDLAGGSPEEVARLRALLNERTASTGQGFHLAVVNQPASGPNVTRFAGRLRVEAGALRILGRGQLEPEDTVVLSGDATELRFDLTGRNYESARKQRRFWHVDEDWIRFEADPPGAILHFESFTAEEEQGSVFLGPERTAAPALPIRFTVADPELWLRDPGTLLPRQFGLSLRVAPGAYLAAVPPAETEALGTLDPTERERLRALGYLAD